MMDSLPRCINVFFLLLLGTGVVACGTDRTDSSAEEMAEGHEGDTPSATAATRAPDVPVEGRMVRYSHTKSGPDIRGYLAEPVRPDSLLRSQGRDPETERLPGLVVIHEWWGLNDNIRAMTRRLAGEGIRALAVDLYRDSTATTPKQAQALMSRAMKDPRVPLANIQSAAEYLRSESGASRLAVIGWCFGGGMVFRTVADAPTKYEGAVAYYGTPEPMTTPVLEKLETPILAHFGSEDEVVSMKQVQAFRSRVEETEADVQIYTYEAGHAFANPSGENYEAAAAKQAWQRTTSFLQQVLSPADES